LTGGKEVKISMATYYGGGRGTPSNLGGDKVPKRDRLDFRRAVLSKVGKKNVWVRGNCKIYRQWFRGCRRSLAEEKTQVINA